MAEDPILLDVSDGVATITLNRPDAANAIDMEFAQQLLAAAIECEENPDIRAVILTGAGDRFFSAGGDLKYFMGAGMPPSQVLKSVTVPLHAAVTRFARMAPPVVVVLNGAAAGGGLSMCACGDIVLAHPDVVFTLAYTASGLSPDGSSTFFLPRVLGLRRTQELMLTNRKFSAEEAAEWGLITRVVPKAELMGEAQALAAKFAKGPTRAYGGVKTLLAETFSNQLETQMEREAHTIADMARSADGQEGMNAFAEKRKPVYRGV